MIRVLIADDHAIFRQGLAMLLTRSGSVELVGQADNGHEALALARKTRPDIAILDLSMPGSNGIETIRALRRERLDVKCLLLTMHNDPKLAARAFSAGADAFLLKENAFEELARAMEHVLAGKRFVSQSVALEMIVQPPGIGKSALTAREEEVLQWIAQGLTNRQIAEKLCISIKTVDTHRTRLMEKLDLHTTAQLVRYAIKTGLVRP